MRRRPFAGGLRAARSGRAANVAAFGESGASRLAAYAGAARRRARILCERLGNGRDSGADNCAPVPTHAHMITAVDVQSSPNAARSGVAIRALGRTDYETTWRAMQEFTGGRVAATPDEIWLTEHPPVYTLGLAGRREHLLRDNGIP